MRNETATPSANSRFTSACFQSAKVRSRWIFLVTIGAKPFRSVLRVDTDAVFASRLAAVDAARQAARQVAELRATEGRSQALRGPPPTRAGARRADMWVEPVQARPPFLQLGVAQSTPGRHPFKPCGVNVVRLNGAAETVRARRLQPGERTVVAAATVSASAHHRPALSAGCRVGGCSRCSGRMFESMEAVDIAR